MSKKFLVLALVFVLAASFSAYADGLKIGTITKAYTTEEDFNSFSANLGWKWVVFDPSHNGERGTFYFYDSLISMYLALNRGDIQEIDVPQAVGEYAVATNPDYKISCVMRTKSINLAFGFLDSEKGKDLQKRFNAALGELRASGKLGELQEKYIKSADYKNITAVKFDKFDGAETIKAAVTGDMPPIDFVAIDGEAAGFNTALLAEIGRILKINIDLVPIESIARTPALTSGRADVVFWYQYIDGVKQYDIPENVIVSDPYYDWDLFVQIRKK